MAGCRPFPLMQIERGAPHVGRTVHTLTMHTKSYTVHMPWLVQSRKGDGCTALLLLQRTLPLTSSSRPSMTCSLPFLQPCCSRYCLASSRSPFLSPRVAVGGLVAWEPSLVFFSHANMPAGGLPPLSRLIINPVLAASSLQDLPLFRDGRACAKKSSLFLDFVREDCCHNQFSRPCLTRRKCNYSTSGLRASHHGTTLALSLLLHARSFSTISSFSDINQANTVFDSGSEGVEACGEVVQQLLPAVESIADYSNQKSPLLLKHGMNIPEKWNVPGGTVVLMDKPKGWTSFTVCEKIRKLVQVKKVGHAGTLDPMATGLLVVCVGPATKLADRFQALAKVYTGTFRLGEATSSCDADSPVIEKKSWEHITDIDIQNAKEGFLGEIMQIPPMFSAIKIEGERLYEKARRGEQIAVPARKITIYEFEIERNKEDRQELDFYVRCSKGTYIRSLCADMGKALNSCAHLTKLRREKIGDLDISDAWQFEDLSQTYRNLFRKPVLDKTLY